MEKKLKVFGLMVLLLSMTFQTLNETQTFSEEKERGTPMMNFIHVPEYVPSYFPPRYPEIYSRPDFRSDFYSPYSMYYPVPVERRLKESEPANKPPVVEEKEEEGPPKESWWQNKSVENDKPVEIKPRKLEVVPLKKEDKPKNKERKLQILTIKQKTLAKLIRPFIQDIKKNKYQTIEEYKSVFDRTFMNDHDYFVSHFWPIIQINFNPDKQPHLQIRKVENAIVHAIFSANLSTETPQIIKTTFNHIHIFKPVEVSKISQFLKRLALEREISPDSSDSLNGFQLRNDFKPKYQLLENSLIMVIAAIL